MIQIETTAASDPFQYTFISKAKCYLCESCRGMYLEFLCKQKHRLYSVWVGQSRFESYELNYAL